MQKEGVEMKFADHLTKEQKRQLEQSSKKNEQLTKKDIEELMGMKMDRYTRRNGAVRRK
jgi:hypothetical protein